MYHIVRRTNCQLGACVDEPKLRLDKCVEKIYRIWARNEETLLFSLDYRRNWIMPRPFRQWSVGKDYRTARQLS